MKITFLKDHIDFKEGDTIDVDENRGNYLVAVGAASAVQVKEKIVIPEAKEKKEIKPGKEKKEL